MRERIAGIAATGAAVVLFIIAVVFVAGRDSDGPIIMVPSDMSYKDGQDVNTLLNGVTAVDDRDGDVSNTLVVESLIVLGEGNMAKVTYIARDSSNNVSHADSIISYSGDGNNIYSTFSAADRESTAESEITKGYVTEDTKEPTSEEKTTDAATEEKTTEEDTSEEKTDNEDAGGEAAADEMTSKEAVSGEEETTEEETTEEKTTEESSSASGVPVLKLLEAETTINKGEAFKVFKFVESITDDKDDKDYLYQRINIDGQYDIYTPGDYELYIFCVDSEAHQSNREKFVLHVAGSGQ